jgi:hypothetical protein
MTPVFVCFSYFSDRVLAFFLGPVSGFDPPTYTFLTAGIIGIHHLTWPEEEILKI